MKRIVLMMATVMIFYGGLNAQATTYYVDAAKADDSGNGRRWETAKKSILALLVITMFFRFVNLWRH